MRCNDLIVHGETKLTHITYAPCPGGKIVHALAPILHSPALSNCATLICQNKRQIIKVKDHENFRSSNKRTSI